MQWLSGFLYRTTPTIYGPGRNAPAKCVQNKSECRMIAITNEELRLRISTLRKTTQVKTEYVPSKLESELSAAYRKISEKRISEIPVPPPLPNFWVVPDRIDDFESLTISD